MLSCISNFRRRFAAYKALVTPLCLLAGFLVFGCSQPTTGGGDYQPPKEPPVLPSDLAVGYYQAPLELQNYGGPYIKNDGFELTSSGNFYHYFDAAMKDGHGGKIVKIVPGADSSVATVVIVKIDKSDDNSGYMTMPVKGKYFAYAYKNASTMPSEAAAYKQTNGKNTGVDTIEEAESEYTVANGYFDYFGVYSVHKVTAKTLGNLNGIWVLDADNDYFIEIRGSTYLEYYDYETDGSGFNTSEDQDTAELYDIVECTNASAETGIMYMKVAASAGGFSVDEYVAVAWLDKNSGTINFVSSTDSYVSLDLVKAAKTDPSSSSQFQSSPSAFTKN